MNALRQIGTMTGLSLGLSLALVAEIDGQKVWLSANSDVAVIFEEEKSDRT